jgi:nucleoside-diphosphate-sugar epimerase
MTSRNVLVTGHMGFVGRNLCRALEDRGDKITGIDIKEGNDCRDFFKHNHTQFDLVVHLAAIVGGRECIENEPLSVATDLSIDAEMFNWAVKTEQPRIVYYSSSAAYPISIQNDSSPRRLREEDINLDDVHNPDFSYGWSKLTGEILTRFAREAGIKVHVFRPFSGYGADQDLDYPFPSFIQRLARKEDPFEIWGDGEQVRDFIHIFDIVNATLKAVDEDLEGPYNLGCGRPLSFNELAQIAFDIAGYSPKVTHRLDKPVGVRYRCANTDKMLEFFTPTISIEHGITAALKLTAL